MQQQHVTTPGLLLLAGAVQELQHMQQRVQPQQCCRHIAVGSGMRCSQSRLLD